VFLLSLLLLYPINLYQKMTRVKQVFSGIFSVCRVLAYCLVITFTSSPFFVFGIPNLPVSEEDSVEIARMTRAAVNLLKSGQFDESRLMIDSVYCIAAKSGWDKKIGDCYFNYGLIERQQGNLDGFFENAEKAVQIYLKNKAWSEAARTCTGIAQARVNQKNYPAAHQHFAQSLKMRELVGDTLGITNNLINIGNLYYLEGQHSDASEYFFRALRYADASENNNLTAIALMNIGNVLIVQKNYETANEYLQKSLQYHRNDKNLKEESKVLHNLGIVYFELGDLTKAKEFYYKAKIIKEELKTDFPELVKIYNNLGLIAKREGNIAEAESFFTTTLDLARKVNDSNTEAAVLNNLGSIKLEQNSHESLPFILQSLEISQNLGLRKIVLSNYQNLQQYYSRQSNYEQAYKYALHYQALDDSIYNDESAAKIIELQTKYDTELKEKENRILTAENLIRKQNQRFSLIAIFILILLTLSLLWAFMLKRKSLLQSSALFARETELSQLKIETVETQNQHLRESLFAEEEIKKLQAINLERQKQELTSATMLIANKNEVFEKLRILAEQIKINDTDKYGKAREIIAEIDRQTDLSDQWEEFKIHFESIHKSFFENLRKMNGSLTQNDMQMCAYIKLNLSTKEISRLMNITPESVNTHRYRLRKKLRLSNGEILDELVHGL
jgi:tetratricopeptide (TPR) repeat protein